MPTLAGGNRAVPPNDTDTIESSGQAEYPTQPRKHAIVIMDGAADVPVPELGHRTPLQVADIPTIDWLAARGRTGLMQTMYEGLPIGSIVATIGILGYDPTQYYPRGRASFEALAQGLSLDDDDLILRCNLISLDTECRISDFTSNQISDQDARAIIDGLRFADPRVEVYSGQSYRNLLIVRGVGCLAGQIECYEPHTHIGVSVDDLMMRALDERAAELVDDLNEMMRNSIDQIGRINDTRHTAADMIWLWSASCPPRMPGFTSRFGARGAVVAGLDFMRGIALAMGMQTSQIQGATGYLDTDLRQKLRYARNYLQHNDVVVVHVNAPDEEAHLHRAANKVRAIERIDHEIVGPLLDFLNANHSGHYRLAVLPDHTTRLSDGQHTADPVPYLIYGDGIAADEVPGFDELTVGAATRQCLRSYDFMQVFLRMDHYAHPK